MRKLCSSALALLPCLSLACGDDSTSDSGNTNPDGSGSPASGVTTESPDSTGANMVTSGTPGTTASPPGSTGETSGATTMGVEPPPIGFDLGTIPEAPPFDGACGQVDFLFVIDNSGSMSGEQNTLVNNFPSFITGIQQTLEGVDSYHVGVVTSDTYGPNIAGCQQLSSLVVQTGGADSSNSACGPYTDGANFMTENDDLANAFTCAAQVGTDGSFDERQMQAAVEAVTGVEAGPGECNFGFIREDALLVIVIITDEPDNASVGDAQSWYDDVVAAKDGHPENIVVLSIINTPAGICGNPANEISAFTMMFGINGFEADICLPDYEPFFQDAIELIDVACEGIHQD